MKTTPIHFSLKKLTSCFLLLLAFDVFGQNENPKFQREVLQKNQIGEKFIDGTWNENGSTELHLTYLGLVNNEKNNIFKLMNSSLFWGYSKRATNRILVFNEKNQYVGNYPNFILDELPTQFENGYLIFLNSKEDCDPELETKINFNKGIPSKFFRKCKAELGDFYFFD